MSPSIPLYNPAPRWTGRRSQYLYLYHGCTADDQGNIQAHGIDLSKCRVDTD